MASGPQLPINPPNSQAAFSFSLRPAPYNQRSAMAPTSASPTISKTKKTCDINNLMSPPEAPSYDSFGHSNNNNDHNDHNDASASVNASNSSGVPGSIDVAMSDARRPPGPIPPLSPPISPAVKIHDDHATAVVPTPAKDPILYPTHDIANSPPQQPLFAGEESIDADRIVENHILARSAHLFGDVTPPKKKDYELALHFQSQVMARVQADPRTWLQRERSFLIKDRQAQARHRQSRLQPILPAKPQPVRKEAQRAKPARASKVTKPVAAAKPTPAKPRPIRAGPGPAAAAVVSAAVAAGLAKPATRVPSSTPDPSPRRGTTQTRADDDFASVEDFCPPIDSMACGVSSLRMEWKTGATDLTNDPHRHLLHEEELHLASGLRLTAAVYLTSKRRIFVKRLECLRIEKEFRKTDAQQACKIDVNKASKLWTAFDKFGWLDKAWVAKYL